MQCQGHRLVKIQVGLVKKRFASSLQEYFIFGINFKSIFIFEEKGESSALFSLRTMLRTVRIGATFFSLTCIFNELKVHLSFVYLERQQSIDYWQYNPLEREFALFACLLSQVSCWECGVPGNFPTGRWLEIPRGEGGGGSEKLKLFKKCIWQKFF